MPNESKKTHFNLILLYTHQIGIIILMIAVLWVLPLYHRGMFNQISEMKFLLYRNVSLVVFGFLTAATIVYAATHLLTKSREKQKFDLSGQLERISGTDWFVIFFLIVTIFSFLLQNWPEGVALWGFPARRMGLMSQIFFVLTYFFASRYFTVISDKTSKIWQGYKSYADVICVGMLVVAFIVMLLGLLHRFWLDPFGILEGFHPKDVSNALSTIGNPNRFSAFLALMLPFGLFIYWQAKNIVIRAIMGVYLAVCFGAAVTQNSESFFVALIAIMLFLFWFSFASNLKMKRFLEICIIMFASFKIIGLLQTIEVERMFWLDPIWLFLSQSVWTWFLLGFFIIIYLAFYYLDLKSKVDVSKLGKFRLGCIISMFVGMVLVIAYIVLNSVGMLPEALRSSGVFLFDDEWGSGRGFTWRLAINTFLELPFLQQLFGAGPHGFWSASNLFFSHESRVIIEGAAMLEVVHNEWLEALINNGILGSFAYIGIFISAIKRYTAKIAAHPFLLPICISLAGYMAHNIFTFQKINTTPAIFIFIGVAEAILREEK